MCVHTGQWISVTVTVLRSETGLTFFGTNRGGHHGQRATGQVYAHQAHYDRLGYAGDPCLWHVCEVQASPIKWQDVMAQSTTASVKQEEGGYDAGNFCLTV